MPARSYSHSRRWSPMGAHLIRTVITRSLFEGPVGATENLIDSLDFKKEKCLVQHQVRERESLATCIVCQRDIIKCNHFP